MRGLLQALFRAWFRVRFGPPKANPRVGSPQRYPAAAPIPESLPGALATVRFDAHRAYEIAEQGVLVQRAAIDVLLTDGRMSRIGVIAYYAPETFEPLRLSYVPIHELAETTEMAG